MQGWKKAVVVMLTAGVMAGFTAQVQARVTEKVDAMIAENTPLKVNDNDLWVMVGGPLVYGVQYDKWANANLALGLGVGSCYGTGTSVDMSMKAYFLPGRFSPFIALGPVFYFSSPSDNILGIFGTFGFSYFFDSGLGMSLGVSYVKSLSSVGDIPFAPMIINDSINVALPQFGLHWNF